MHFLIVQWLLAGFVQAATEGVDFAPNQAETIAPVVAPIDFIHPVLLGSLVDPESPLRRAVEQHAATILKEPLAAPSYLARLSQEGPVARAAAAVLTRVIHDPAAARMVDNHAVLSSSHFRNLARHMTTADHGVDLESMAPLIEVAREERSVVDFFDHGREQPSLEFDEGLEATDEGISTIGGSRPERLGRGEFGTVQHHPMIEGVVMKTLRADVAASINFAGRTQQYMNTVAEQEELIARLLASAGAGPRFLGSVHSLPHDPEPNQRSATEVLLGLRDAIAHPILVKEEMIGQTVGQLIREKQFTRQNYILVIELLRRMLEHGVAVTDSNRDNIVIGHTLVDPRRRASYIDGGSYRGKPSTFEDLYHHVTLLQTGRERLSDMLEAGLRRSEVFPFDSAMHPLLLGSVADAETPLGGAVRRYAQDILQQLPVAPADVLTPLLQQGPVARAAAAILIRVVVNPERTQTLLDHFSLSSSHLADLVRLCLAGEINREGMQALIAGTRKEKAPDVFFNKRREQTLFELKGIMPTSGGGLNKATAEMPLYRGPYGVSFHPTIDGVVIKTVRDVQFSRTTTQDVLHLKADDNESMTRLLERDGIGPRMLGRAELPDSFRSLSYPVLLKERVYGETVGEMIKELNFTAADYALVLNLLERMSRAGRRFSGFTLEDVMIGHTPMDPTRRAYLVNGAERSDSSVNFRDLYEYRVEIYDEWGRYFGRRRLGELLTDGVKDNRRRSPE